MSEKSSKRLPRTVATPISDRPRRSIACAAGGRSCQFTEVNSGGIMAFAISLKSVCKAFMTERPLASYPALTDQQVDERTDERQCRHQQQPGKRNTSRRPAHDDAYCDGNEDRDLYRQQKSGSSEKEFHGSTIS